jgi:hypothetical protein
LAYTFEANTPESREHYRELNAFLLHHLPVSRAKARMWTLT